MTIICDTREPPKYIKFLRKTFPELTFENYALPEGDYQSNKCIVERKQIADLYGSIIGPSRRIHNQVERISCHEDKVQVILITGSVGDFVTKMKEIGVRVDSNILFGEIASIACRYGIQPLWIEDEWSAMITMVKFMTKVDEGKHMVPVRRDPDILAAKLIGVSTKQLGILLDHHGSLAGICIATDKELMKVKGIGPNKAAEIKRVLTS
jgi:ERCC4-type nuclease